MRRPSSSSRPTNGISVRARIRRPPRLAKHPRYPLETWQKLHNAWTGSVRSAVERAFATMKRWYGMGRVRYLGRARNACHLQFVAMAMNMKRALVLMRAA